MFPEKNILNKQVFDETWKLLDNIEHELSLFKDKDAPSLAPEQHDYAFENDTSCVPPMQPEAASIPDRGFGSAAGPSAESKMTMTSPSCPKCEGHAFERGQIAPLGERQAVPVLQCVSCGAVVGTLATAQAIEDLQKQIAAIDAKLVRIVKALQKQ